MNTPTGTTAARKHSFVHLARQWWAAGMLAVAILIFVTAPWPLMDKLFAIAYGICPQRPAHSLFFGGQQMSIEARMFGMFGGAVAAALYLAARGRGKATGFPQPGILAVLIGFVAWMGLDGVNALFFDLLLPHGYTPTLTLRLGTGLLAGLAIGAVIVPAFNQTIWLPSAARNVPVLSGWRDLFGVLGIEAVLFAGGLTGWSVLLYPYSILASVGVLGMLSAIDAIIVALILRRDGRFTSVRELSPVVLIGLVFATVMLGSTAAVRFALFGLGPMGF
jgi:uncharacterized membrane protein